MKRIFGLLMMFATLTAYGQQTANKAPFSRGVNFSNWFEYVKNTQGINFGRFTEQDFADVKRLGVDVIRIPIDFTLFTSTAPNYIIEPLVFLLLDKVADWAEKYQIYIILDNHTGDCPPTNTNIRNFLIPVWTQIAQHYKDRSQYVIYEIQNEPNHISSSNWGRIQGDVIDAIRKIDKQHWIVVTGADNDDGYSSVSTLTALPRYTDNKLLYTFHFYLPMVFTHQGVSSIDPLYEHLAKIPFPYDRNRMPTTPNGLRGTWLEDHLRSKYPTEGTTAALIRKIDQAASFAKQRNVPVFCGEFGAVNINTLSEDRIRYYRFIRETLEARNISWLIWNYFDGFGIYNSQMGRFNWYAWGDINIDLNVELAQALGFSTVPQKQREPIKSGFNVYDDYFGRGFRLRHYSEPSKVNLFYTQASEGEYAIQWKDINKDNVLEIELNINDFSYLVQNGFVLEFKAKSERPASFNITFWNLQGNIFWKNQISNVQIQSDGKWHTIRIPLNSIKELWGGMEDATWKWHEAQGRAMPWTNIFAMDLQAKHEDGVREIFLDDIKITR